jgi:DNA helicase-2/ATP-dependent DNA helicase PcrA
MEWSDYQKDIFAEVENGEREDHLVVIARAGSGKTSTITESVNYLSPSEDIMLCAFNKGIQTELEARAPAYVRVKTLHGIGFGALAYGAGGKFKVDEAKVKGIIKELQKIDYGPLCMPEGRYKLRRLTGLAKNTLAETQKDIVDLAYNHDIEDGEDYNAEEMAEIVLKIMDRCANDIQTIDFDDMLWLPHKLDHSPYPQDVVFVDEAQDLNAAQFSLVRKMLGQWGRMIAVGDDKQAIYAWRGAGYNVIPALIEEFDAKTLPLSITYRCPKKVVEVANAVVPDFYAAPDAEDGIFEDATREQMIAEAKPGDFVLSRTNAPLISACLEFLQRDIPASIAGRDLATTLIKLARKPKVTSCAQLRSWLTKFLQSEKERLEVEDYDQRYEYIKDKVSCLMVLSDKMASVDDLTRRIENIFSDKDDRSVILCSTVHKAKGLERDRVWLLRNTFHIDNSGGQERNVYYVGVTRAHKALYFVHD